MLDNIGLVHTTNDMWSVEYLLEVVKSITYNLLCLVVESLFKSLRIFISISIIASMYTMALPVVEFSRQGYKIGKVFA